MTEKKDLEKLWGIGEKTAKSLISEGISSIEEVAEIKVEEISKKLGVRKDYLTIAKAEAEKLSTEFVQSVKSSTFRIVRKIHGVGLDFGLLLYAYGVKDIESVTPKLKIKFPALEDYLAKLLERTKSQVQLALICGLTSKQARNLVVKGDVTSLEDFSQRTDSELQSLLDGVSLQKIEAWKQLASGLVENNILDYKKAGSLPLAKKVRGIGPEIGATLYVLGITTPEELAIKMHHGIRDEYFPWVSNSEYKNWIEQVVPAYKKLPVSQRTIGVEPTAPAIDWKSWESPDDWATEWSDEYWCLRRLTYAEVWCMDRFGAGIIAAWTSCSGIGFLAGFVDTILVPSGESYKGRTYKQWAEDAFTHTYWNCCMVRGFAILDELAKPLGLWDGTTAEEKAKMFADAHELFPNNPADQKAMDYHNNQLGRDLAVRPEEILGPGLWGIVPCEIMVCDALNRGKGIIFP